MLCRVCAQFCESCARNPIAARICLGDKTFAYCKECTVREQAEYERRLRQWESAQLLRQQRSGVTPVIPDARQHLALIEQTYERLVGRKLFDAVPFERLGDHFDRLLSSVDPNGSGNGIDLEFRYLSIAAALVVLSLKHFTANNDLNRYANVAAPDHSLVPLVALRTANANADDLSQQQPPNHDYVTNGVGVDQTTDCRNKKRNETRARRRSMPTTSTAC